MQQSNVQIELPDTELSRLSERIWHNFTSADANHQVRIERFRRYYRMWRGLPVTSGNVDDGGQLQIPMMKWITFGEWSRIMGALLGDDAEISASPVAPLDNKVARKVGEYMTWRFFEYMKGTPALSAWMFRAVLFGRSHAYCPYEREYYWERRKPEDVDFGALEENGLRWKKSRDGMIDIEQVSYDGPKIIPLWPSEIILPAQVGVHTVTDFDWKIRRVRVTPQQLLDGEAHGIYQGITKNWNEIISFAQQQQEREYWWDYEQIDADQAEGTSYATMMGNRNSVEVWQWYGKWRLPTNKRNSRPENIDDREKDQSELLVNFLPRPRLVVGVQDLRTLYPRSKKRDPFLDVALVKDGSYWGPGMGEMIEDLQNKSTANYALFERSGKLAVGPVVFYKPSGGFDPDTFEYAPGVAIPTDDPTSVNVVKMTADLKFSTDNQQALQGFAEKVTGVTDQTNGVSIDRPNAPRTLGGQQLLQEQANLRGQLDLMMLRDDLSVAMEYFWSLDREFSSDETVFRVIGEDIGDVFETDNGFGVLTSQEREHNFDFQLKFATSVWSKEAEKAVEMQLYQLSVQNPLVVQNPKALWTLLDRVWKAMGKEGFSEIIAPPPDIETPKRPQDEWSLMLKGDEDVEVNVLDDDDKHIIDHRRRLEREMNQLDENRDPAAEKEMVEHIKAHEQQKQMKQLLQIEAAKIQAQMDAAQQTIGVGPVAPQTPLAPQGQQPPQGQPQVPGPQAGAPVEPVRPLGV